MIRPTADNVLLEILDEDWGGSKASLKLVKASKAKNWVKAKVVAVGPGRIQEGKRVPMRVSVGDIVVLPKFAIREVESSLGKFYFTKDVDVVMKLEE